MAEADKLDLSKAVKAGSGRSGNGVYMLGNRAYKVFELASEEYKKEVKAVTGLRDAAVPVAFQKGLEKVEVTLPDGTKGQRNVIQMEKFEGVTYMLPKPGHTKSFLNDVKEEFAKQRQVNNTAAVQQLKRLCATFEAAQKAKLRDPQGIFKVTDTTLDFVFIDAHTVGASVSAIEVDTIVIELNKMLS
eukprot:TRINITY_DN39924_c0_g1_i1.p1 TRINITY_DN39924_c0_g1~~TRINITY_DN39924_c0_g1_i1.p1  ORF type:complete len:206 (-),score=49.06 TRINITY_DN39924_c0_g1_i1:49-612(-)